MITKICFKCNSEKPLTEYYIHRQMSDGHLNKCKNCTKKDAKNHSSFLKNTDPDYMDRERKRGRDKFHRLYKGTVSQNHTIHARNWAIKNPERKKAASSCKSIPSLLGHRHHWSYNKEHWKDVIDITIKDHNKAHRFIVYDQEHMMYRRSDNNELLDTKKRHLEWINWCIKNKED